MHMNTVTGRSGKKVHYFTRRLTVGILLFASTITAALARDEGYYPVQELLVTGETVVGEKIQYPTTGAPRITVAVVTVAPNTQAGFHRHPVPLVAYVLEGELTVDYGEKGVKTFRQGDAVVEAMNAPHRGMNLGSGVVKLLAVYVGAEGSANATLEKQP